MNRKIISSICITSLILLGGCGTLPPAPVEERGETPPANPYAVNGREAVVTPYKRYEDSVPQESQGSGAVVSLLNDADHQARKGRLDSSAASIERALRIQPRNPNLWLQLAKIRMQQGKLQQAEGLAAKSMALSLNNKQLRVDNWRLVAQIRQKRGDQSGARAALDRVKALESAE